MSHRGNAGPNSSRRVFASTIWKYSEHKRLFIVQQHERVDVARKCLFIDEMNRCRSFYRIIMPTCFNLHVEGWDKSNHRWHTFSRWRFKWNIEWDEWIFVGGFIGSWCVNENGYKQTKSKSNCLLVRIATHRQRSAGEKWTEWKLGNHSYFFFSLVRSSRMIDGSIYFE